MKKIVALTLTGVIALAGAATFAACTTDSPDLSPQENLYFVPGTYVSNGEKVENEISSGATKLSEEVCASMNTENVYRCALGAGQALPVPTSARVDKDGVPYTFNGWWSIVNATVTYYDKVPTVTTTTFLYADWRADLSQCKDPIIPDAGVVVEPNHYMSVVRAESGETERITLRKAFTNMMNAETLGYLYPVELVAEGFELCPGDVITVYTTGLKDSEEAVISPVLDSSRKRSINLESSGDGSNVTADYLQAADLSSYATRPTVTCIAEEVGYYNIYIKYFSGGSIMAVYMEPRA